MINIYSEVKMWYFENLGKFCSVFKNYRNTMYPLESHHLGENTSNLKYLTKKVYSFRLFWLSTLLKFSILFFLGWKHPSHLNLFMCDDQASLIFCQDYQCLQLCWAHVRETYEGVSLPWSSQGLKGQPTGRHWCELPCGCRDPNPGPWQVQ